MRSTWETDGCQPGPAAQTRHLTWLLKRPTVSFYLNTDSVWIDLTCRMDGLLNFTGIPFIHVPAFFWEHHRLFIYSMRL